MSAAALELARMAVRALPKAERAALVRELSGAPAEPDRPRVLRRGEVALMLGRTPRAVDLLAAQGVLSRVTLPGRTRGAGFREADVRALIEARA